MTERRLECESERIRTFAQWPANAPVQVDDLAKNGFFATGNWLEVECNWCHMRIDHWEYGDQVADRHRRASPICSIVLAPNHCGNVPLESASEDQSNDREGNNVVDSGGSQQGQCACPDLLIEANRLETFKNWPNPNITPQALAKAGFYYLNQSDRVRCVWCKGVIAKWEKNDNAFDEHRRFFPNCPRVQMGPLIEFAGKDLEELGIQPTTMPHRPQYACIDTRLRTFSNWPIPNIQSAEALAQAGLYYQKIDDQVRCFHCNIGLRSWQKEDEPWHEHAKWSPKCQYVLLAKGPQFVREVCEAAAASPTAATSPATPNNISTAMSSAPACAALALGIDVGVVRSTMARKLSITGCAYNTLDDLLHAIFDEAGGDSAALEVSAPMRNPGTPTARDNSEPTTSKTVPVEPAKPKITETSAPEANAKEKSTTLVKSSTPNGNLSLEEENRLLKDARLCKVCLDEEVGVVFLPCGHLATCNQCAPNVVNCPMCRSEIKGFVRTFLS